jgi:dynamin 1-like protein
MEQLIPIASKLQDVLGAVGQSTTLDLPQIVVVGGQSSGKSSVLEGLVGRSFLPRGHGIVTRRPLVLQLYNTRAPPSVDDDDDDDEDADVDGGVPQEDEFDLTADENHHQQENIDPTNAAAAAAGKNRRANTSTSTTTAGDEWGEFLHLPGRKFYSFSSIRQEIVKETDRLTGTNKGINPTPINLKIYSPHVLALTMVDLPGMAKVPIGDQPDNIEEQIHQMSLQYISNPNAIILAVTSANTDLANSDALKLACAADPRGERTIGVLTKLDLMDPGTDASDILLNKVIPLRHGYIAVVNRGQIDINADVSIRDGLKKEDAFFRNHPVYSRNRGLLMKCGTRHLAKTLNTMLMHHIRDCLPELKNRISHMMADVQVELEALGTPSMNSSRSSLGGSLLNLLSKFATNFASVLDGRGVGETHSATSSSSTRSGHKVHELFGGARVSYIFTEIFATSLLCVRAFDGLSDEEIRMTICNANGTRPALFVPEISFDILSRRQIARLEQPGIQCVDLVYEELQRIASQSEPTELTRFPVLRERMVEVVSALLKRCVGPTQMMVSNLIKIELAVRVLYLPTMRGEVGAVEERLF